MNSTKSMSSIAKKVATEKEMRQAVEDELRFNADILKEGSESIIPRLVIFSKKTLKSEWLRTAIMITDMPPESKYEIMHAVGYKLAKEKKAYPPIMVTFTCEAWMRKFTKDEEEARTKPIRDYDDKKEVITTAACTMDKRELMGMVDVTRDADNKIIPGQFTYNDKTQGFLLYEFYKGYAAGL